MALKTIDLVDPLGDDYEARDKRGKAVQRELVIETHAREWIKTSVVESMLIEVGTMTCSILAGIPDSLRAQGASEEMVKGAQGIIDAAKSQVAQGLDAITMDAVMAVDAIESELEQKAMMVDDEQREPGAPRRPRGLSGAPKRAKKK